MFRQTPGAMPNPPIPSALAVLPQSGDGAAGVLGGFVQANSAARVAPLWALNFGQLDSSSNNGSICSGAARSSRRDRVVRRGFREPLPDRFPFAARQKFLRGDQRSRRHRVSRAAQWFRNMQASPSQSAQYPHCGSFSSAGSAESVGVDQIVKVCAFSRLPRFANLYGPPATSARRTASRVVVIRLSRPRPPVSYQEGHRSVRWLTCDHTVPAYCR